MTNTSKKRENSRNIRPQNVNFRPKGGQVSFNAPESGNPKAPALDLSGIPV
jgi:hypothetical protein